MDSGFGFEYECLKGTFFTCSVCNYAWRTRTSGADPRSCPNCGTRLWKESFMHTCAGCGHIWYSSHQHPKKCPQCQTVKWAEEEPAEGRSEVPVDIKFQIMSLYRSGLGAVKISMDLGITFSDVFDVISEAGTGADVIL